MKKTKKTNKEQNKVEEPVVPYTVNDHFHPSGNSFFFEKTIQERTLSVDEYFDELVSQIHADYANL
jgi:hypothetical protein